MRTTEGGAAATILCLQAALARAAGGDIARSGAEVVEAASRTILLAVGVVALLILLPVAFLLYRRLFSAVGAAPTGAVASPLALAEREERRGNFLAAAAHFQAAGERLRAAGCFERGKDLASAADCLEAAGELERAAQLHLRSGGSLKAAEIFMKTGNHVEAAKIFRNKGDHLRAAQGLEMFGNKVAAAREYAAAGQHARAARLLEEEKMYAEAAEAYRPLLGEEVTAADADRHATWAALLALAGAREQAIAAYRRVLAVNPDHPRAYNGLRALVPREATPAGAAAPAAPHPPPPQTDEELAREIDADAAGEPADLLEKAFTLRSMIRAGRMEPRYSMRLWVQVMRALAERHRGGEIFGCLVPEAITIDMQNNVRIEAPRERPTVYLAPEVRDGRPADRRADIYSMGVILYELTAGSLEGLGSRRAGEIHRDVPPWLDELIARCLAPDPAGRYGGAEEISEALLKLKGAAQG